MYTKIATNTLGSMASWGTTLLRLLLCVGWWS
jgi:hypothetical protein